MVMWSRLWRKVIPLRFYRSAAGGWFFAVRKRDGWRGYHIHAVP